MKYEKAFAFDIPYENEKIKVFVIDNDRPALYITLSEIQQQKFASNRDLYEKVKFLTFIEISKMNVSIKSWAEMVLSKMNQLEEMFKKSKCGLPVEITLPHGKKTNIIPCVTGNNVNVDYVKDNISVYFSDNKAIQSEETLIGLAENIVNYEIYIKSLDKQKKNQNVCRD